MTFVLIFFLDEWFGVRAREIHHEQTVQQSRGHVFRRNHRRDPQRSSGGPRRWRSWVGGQTSSANNK